MTTVSQAFRDYVTDGVPSSGYNQPSLAEIRAALTPVEARAVQRINVHSLCWDSWGEEPPAFPDSLAVYMQANLDAATSLPRWWVQNDSIGGTSLGTTSPAGTHPTMLARLPGILARGNVRRVSIGTFLNDISLGNTATQIIADIATAKSLCDAAGIDFVVTTIPPFKKSAFYNTTTRGYADTVNAHIRATYPGKYIDLWNLFNDPADDGSILMTDVRGTSVTPNDWYHLNPTGRAKLAAAKVNGAGSVAAHTWTDGSQIVGVRAAGVFNMDQHLMMGGTLKMKYAVLGGRLDDGPVRALNIVPASRLYDLGHMFLGSRLSSSAGGVANGWDDAGDWVFSSLTGGTLYERARISGANGVHMVRDGNFIKATTTTFNGSAGGGAFFAMSTAGMNVSVLSGGGSAVGTFAVSASGIQVSGASGNPAKGQISFGTTNAGSVTFDGSGFFNKYGGYVLPSIDNATIIGNSTYRFASITLATSPIVTSDIRTKKDRAPIDLDQALRVVLAVETIKYRQIEGTKVVTAVKVGTRQVRRPVMETVTKAEPRIEVVDGRAVRTIVEVLVEQQKVEILPMFNEAGQPQVQPIKVGEDAEGKDIIEYVQAFYPNPVFEDVEEDIFEDSVSSTEGSRWHLGFSAQGFVRALRVAGVEDPFSYALMTLTTPGDETSLHGMRLDHLHALTFTVMKAQILGELTQARIRKVKAEVDAALAKLEND